MHSYALTNRVFNGSIFPPNFVSTGVIVSENSEYNRQTGSKCILIKFFFTRNLKNCTHCLRNGWRPLQDGRSELLTNLESSLHKLSRWLSSITLWSFILLSSVRLWPRIRPRASVYSPQRDNGFFSNQFERETPATDLVFFSHRRANCLTCWRYWKNVIGNSVFWATSIRMLWQFFTTDFLHFLFHCDCEWVVAVK